MSLLFIERDVTAKLQPIYAIETYGSWKTFLKTFLTDAQNEDYESTYTLKEP
jgi:hypothetical protein